MKLKHTPGNWEALITQVIGPDSETIAICNSELEDIATIKANARLIAAAPEMLVLVKYARDCLVDDNKTMREFDRIIAKAEGRDK